MNTDEKGVLEVGDFSDGYHTFNELYQHRNLLFLSLARAYAGKAWWSWLHHDGSGFDEYFVVGLELPQGQITYHLPASMEPLMARTGIPKLDKAPEWDGHSPNDVLDRLTAWLDYRVSL